MTSHIASLPSLSLSALNGAHAEWAATGQWRAAGRRCVHARRQPRCATLSDDMTEFNSNKPVTTRDCKSMSAAA